MNIKLKLTNHNIIRQDHICLYFTFNLKKHIIIVMSKINIHNECILVLLSFQLDHTCFYTFNLKKYTYKTKNILYITFNFNFNLV